MKHKLFNEKKIIMKILEKIYIIVAYILLFLYMIRKGVFDALGDIFVNIVKLDIFVQYKSYFVMILIVFALALIILFLTKSGYKLKLAGAHLISICSVVSIITIYSLKDFSNRQNITYETIKETSEIVKETQIIEYSQDTINHNGYSNAINFMKTEIDSILPIEFTNSELAPENSRRNLYQNLRK